MGEIEKKLLIAQIEGNGIPAKEFAKLSAKEKKLLERKGKKYFLRKNARKRIKVALTGGVFDILHIGHLQTFENAKKFADILAVVIAADETVLRMKKRKPIHPQKYRAKIVSALKPVDAVLLGGKNPQEIIERVKPDFIIFGYDQKISVPKSADYKIIKLRTRVKGKRYKTSEIIRSLEI